VKIVVGIKHVPDTETKIKLSGDSTSIDETGVKWIISPYDEYALEAALRLREAAGTGEVVAVCAGRNASQTTLRQALAIGADRAILVDDVRFERCDALARAEALAGVVRAEAAELVLLGKYSVGTDEGQTGPMLAELLDWPHASAVCSLAVDDGSFTAEREIEGGREVQEGTLPAVISCDRGLNEPRYPALKGIMQAKKKPLDIKSPTDVGVDPALLESPLLHWESLELPPARRPGRLVDGGAEEAANELARILREEAKVI
jgi:electron transfer flavoprotein beta subunit